MEFLHPATWHDHHTDFARWLYPAMWLWNHDSEFIKWQQPAMWHVALGSWYLIRHVAAPSNVAGGSGMTCHWIRQVASTLYAACGFWITCHWIRPNVRLIEILLLVSISTNHRGRHVILHQSPIFYPNRTTLDVMSIFKMTDLSHLGF